MKSITVHKLENDLYIQLLQKSEAEGLSLNKLIKKLLRQSIGLDPLPQKKIDFSEIAGSWSSKEAESFGKHISDFDKVDDKEW